MVDTSIKTSLRLKLFFRDEKATHTHTFCVPPLDSTKLEGYRTRMEPTDKENPMTADKANTNTEKLDRVSSAMGSP